MRPHQIKRLKVCCLLLAAVMLLVSGMPASAARLKDIVSLKGVRSNQLVGYGLVVGLNGTGDKAGTEFTIQSLVNMLERMGVQVDKNDVKVKNVAAVMVTATLPPFVRIGSQIDVVISSIGDATSLMGGTLLLTPLKGVDGKVYALSQGPLAVGGFSASGETAAAVKNHPVVARIARGATVEREVPVNLDAKTNLTIALFNPDFTTALRVASTINSAVGADITKVVDSGTLDLNIPPRFRDRVAEFIAGIESLDVTPDAVAKIVVNEKTGTVVIGENVRISTVAVSHGNLSISVENALNVSQPAPLSGGQTVVTPETGIEIREENASVMVIPAGATIGDLVRALNAVGVTPRDLISIFQSIKAAGALQAEIEII